MSDINEEQKRLYKRAEENDYKKECFKRLEYTNKYSKYSEEDLIEEIIEKDKEIERLNNNINATRNCILKDISILKNRKISNEEMITRLEATLKILENELKGDNK